MALGIGLLVAEAVNPGVGAFGVGGVVSFVIGSVMLMRPGVPGYARQSGRDRRPSPRVRRRCWR